MYELGWKDYKIEKNIYIHHTKGPSKNVNVFTIVQNIHFQGEGGGL